MGEQDTELPIRLTDRLQQWRNDRRMVAAVCACIALAAGVTWWRAGASRAAPPPAPPLTTTAGTDLTTTSASAPAATVIVAVVGAVRAPGVVRVPAGSRVFDAIAAAGGASPNANLAALNLAAPVPDGARVAVPRRGQPAPAIDPGAVTGGPGSGSGSATGSDAGGDGASGSPVNLNTANASELDALPGIGPATSAAIISDREQHGPFRTVDDLARVRGIGPAKLEQLRNLVTV